MSKSTAELERATQQAVDVISSRRDQLIAQIDATMERAQAQRDLDWLVVRRFLRAVGR